MLQNSNAELVLIGDSLISNLCLFPEIWENYFLSHNSLNLGVGGDKTQNVLWRVQNMSFPQSVKNVFVLCGVNNIDSNTPEDIAQSILLCGTSLKSKISNSIITIISILPRDRSHSMRREKITNINRILKNECNINRLHYLPLHDDWLDKKNDLNISLYHTDLLHLSRDGNTKLSKAITKSFLDQKELLKKYVPPKVYHEYELDELEFPHLPKSINRQPINNKYNQKVMSNALSTHLSKYSCFPTVSFSSVCSKNVRALNHPDHTAVKHSVKRSVVNCVSKTHISYRAQHFVYRRNTSTLPKVSHVNINSKSISSQCKSVLNVHRNNHKHINVHQRVDVSKNNSRSHSHSNLRHFNVLPNIQPSVRDVPKPPAPVICSNNHKRSVNRSASQPSINCKSTNRPNYVDYLDKELKNEKLNMVIKQFLICSIGIYELLLLLFFIINFKTCCPVRCSINSCDMTYGTVSSDIKISNNFSIPFMAGSYIDEQYNNFCYKVALDYKPKDHLFHKPKIKDLGTEIFIVALLIKLLFFKYKRNQTHMFTFFYFITLKFLMLKIGPYKVPLYENLKYCSNKTFFSIDTIKISDQIHLNCLQEKFLYSLICSLKFSHHTALYKYMILLSNDVNLNPGPNQIAHANDTWTPFKKRGLHFIHLNVNSLLPKIDEIRYVAQNTNAAVIGITESKLDDSILDSEIAINRYDVLRKDRNRKGGGVVFYIRQNICYSLKNIFPINIENIFVDIMLPKTKPFCVGIFYRPPLQNDFLEDIHLGFSKLSQEAKDIFVMGDMNINTFIDGRNILENTKNTLSSERPLTSMATKYKEFCSDFSLKQLIGTPTRITTNSSTLIDHILTNAKDKISTSGIIDTGLSDHQMIFCTRKLTRVKFNTHKHIQCRSFKRYSCFELTEKLKAIGFPNYNTFSDVDKAFSDFTDRLMKIINEIAPLKKRRIKNNTQDWFDGEIFDSIYARNRLLKKFKRSKKFEDEKIYKAAKYLTENLIKNKKKNYIKSKLQENIAKPKELWKTLKSLGLPNKNTSSGKICIETNGEVSFETEKNAESFKTFFGNLADNLVLKLPTAPMKFGKSTLKHFYEKYDLNNNNFKFSKVSQETVLKFLQDVDPGKAAGIDGIPGRFIKDGADVLALPVTQLCNLSAKLSTFPISCKVAKLKPIFKKGSKTDMQNYRPISLLPLISKILEKVIHDQTQAYLYEFDILYKYQSGFRKNHSTNNCLAYLSDLISKGFDRGLYTGMILIDLQKAFDTIDHDILFDKMSFLGFSEEVINWFKSYLSKRTFLVSIDDKLSNPGSVTCGVPQGSILGPMLFLLYVNDMPCAVDSKLLLYADDSCIIYQHKDTKIIEDKLNEDFKNLCDWFVDNKLSIHFGEEKTKSILFASKYLIKKGNILNISYNGIEIKQHSKVCYLGCILDETLSGESMFLKVISKINAKLKFLYRKNKFLTPLLKRLLCNALIQPHFDYACLAWQTNLNKKFRDKLQVTQNKCIRFCLNLENMSHIGLTEFEKINWLSVENRFIQNICATSYNYFKRNSPDFMTEIFETAHQSNIGTRSSFHRLIQPQRKTNIGQKTLSYLGPQQWNKLPNYLKKETSLNTFKHKLKDHFFDVLKSRAKMGYS